MLEWSGPSQSLLIQLKYSNWWSRQSFARWRLVPWTATSGTYRSTLLSDFRLARTPDRTKVCVPLIVALAATLAPDDLFLNLPLVPTPSASQHRDDRPSGCAAAKHRAVSGRMCLVACS